MIRLNSRRESTDAGFASALSILLDLRCLLLERGVAAAPVGNVVVRTAPEGPGDCRV